MEELQSTALDVLNTKHYSIKEKITFLESFKEDTKTTLATTKRIKTKETSLESKLRESGTKLRRKRISKKDRIVLVKRLRNSKYKSYKKELRYYHGAPIIIVDEAWNILNSKQKV